MASNKAKQAGVTNEEMAKRSANSKKIVNTDLKVKMKTKETQNREYYCTCCGRHWNKQKDNFSASRSPLYKSNNGYVHICKDCTAEYYKQMVDLFDGNEEHAIERMCQIFDWMYHELPLGMSRHISKDRPRVHDYVNKIYMNQSKSIPNCDYTYVTTIKNKNSDTVIESLDEIKDKKAKKSTVKFFGTGFSEEDYDFLEEQYTDWTTRHECQSKAQEEVFKQLCFAQLDILKAKRKGDPAKDELRTFQDLLDTAKLKPKQINTDTLTSDRTFGQLIKLWEDEKPIPEPDEEFKDVDGIARYISVFFLGHLAKMLGVKNKWSKMYEDEMAKYKVEKPEYEDDDDALFESVFSGHLEGDN